MNKAIFTLVLERLFANKDRLLSLIEYLLDYLHDLLAKAVDKGDQKLKP